jgi:oligopeptide transport system ATP-binding protein
MNDVTPTTVDSLASEPRLRERAVGTLEPVVEFRDVVKTFTAADGTPVEAVSHVSLTVHPGETVGLIGESGSGKTTIGKLMLGLIRPDSGQILVEGKAAETMTYAERRSLPSKLQVVFQEPYESLNPRRKIGPTVAEPLVVQRVGDRTSRRSRLAEVLDMVGLPKDVAGRYPGELSGGQQQRVGIARAIVGKPRLIVLDEPTASLDRTIRRQVTDLLTELQRELNLGYLLITHDMASVRRMADRAIVLFGGQQVEVGAAAQVLAHPAHPYTKALASAELRAVPGTAVERFRLLPRRPGAVRPHHGCRLTLVCPLAIDKCRELDPTLLEVSGDHRAACFRWEDVVAITDPDEHGDRPGTTETEASR